MKFTPKTKKEIDSEKILEAGIYPFIITKAEDKVSKAGNDMIVLLMRAYRDDGSFVLVNDYLLESVLYKILHLCENTGLKEKYESGKLEAEDFLHKEGWVKLGIQEETDKYAAKNNVKDYVPEPEGATRPAEKADELSKAIDDDLEDEIPF